MTGEMVNDSIALMLNSGIEQGYFHKDMNVMPTVFMFWASISSIIQLANNKTAYIKLRMEMDKGEFVEYSFAELLIIVLKEGVKQ